MRVTEEGKDGEEKEGEGRRIRKWRNEVISRYNV